MGKRKAAHHEEVKAFLTGKTFETCKDAQWFFEKETGLSLTYISFQRQYIKHSKSVRKNEKINEFLSNCDINEAAIELYFRYRDTYKAEVSLIYFRKLVTEYRKRNK